VLFLTFMAYFNYQENLKKQQQEEENQQKK
jgi:hypothetical protein